MCGSKVNKAESRGLELTRGLGVSRGLGSLELMFPELSGEGTKARGRALVSISALIKKVTSESWDTIRPGSGSHDSTKTNCYSMCP